jgi:hypothetical protein
MHLGSDLYRGKADLTRLAKKVLFPSLIIEKRVITDPTTGEPFYRSPDAVCDCTGKHDTVEQFKMGDKACGVWRKFRGFAPWELWGPPSKAQHRVKLRDGKVPIEFITAQIPKLTKGGKEFGRQPQDAEVRRSWAISRQMASSTLSSEATRKKLRGAS